MIDLLRALCCAALFLTAAAPASAGEETEPVKAGEADTTAKGGEATAPTVDELLTQAADLVTKGQYTKAADTYDAAIKAAPGDARPRLELIGLLAQVAGKEARCKQAIADALKADVFSEDEWQRVIATCTEWGFETEAAGIYRMLLEKHPDNTTYPAKILELTVAGDAPATTVRAEIEKLLGKTPDAKVALALAAMCETYLRFEEAAWLYEKILAQDDANLDARLRLARVYTRWGKLDEAQQLAEKNVELDYEHVDSRLLLAELKQRRGNYEGALEDFRTLNKEEGGVFGAYVGEARAASAIGKYDDAVSACLKALKLDAASPEAHALLGDLYTYTGRYTQAAGEYERALAADPRNVEAMIGRAQSLRDSGKTEEAQQAFYALYDLYESATSERELTARVLAHVGVACRASDDPKNALHCFVEATKKDSTYIPARLWMGQLFLERHQPRDAANEFGDILKINPRHVGALAGLIEVALENSQFEAVQERCEAALAVNPHHVETLNLLASMRILDEQYPAAKEALDASLEVNPNSLETLSHLASYYYQTGDAADYERTLARVLAINPKYARAYEIVADDCGYHRRNEDAIALLRQAIEVDDQYAPAWTSLGSVLLREGLEDEADEALRTAFKLDSFNHRTLNFIKVLETIQKEFSVHETEHFVMKWNTEQDFVLDDVLPESCEEVYHAVCSHFEFEPPNKTLIEVFPKHDEFAARIAGLPFIQTVGACFGKVFAMDSPRTGGFNWREVFAHEFTHVVTLQQTKMRIPFWFTEGLAVCWEKGPKPVEWDRMTVRAAVLDEIVPLDDLSSWFTRARTMNQKQWAYAQSMLITRYLYEHFGREKIVRMLEMYRDGHTTAEVIQAVCGTPQAEFERRIKADIIGRGRAFKVPPLFILDDAERLKARVEANDEDAAAHAYYAEALAQRIAAAQGPVPNEVPDEVRAHAEKAIELDPALAEPYTVLAFLELRSDKPEAAARYCNEALAHDETNYIAHVYLGDIAAGAKRFDEAAEHYEAAERAYPRQSELGHKLAAIYEHRRERDKAIAELERVVKTDRNPYAALKQLGTFYSEREDWKDVIRSLDYALEFNLYDPEIYATLLKAHEERGEDAEAAHCRSVGADVALFAAMHELKADRKIALLRLALRLVPDHERTLEYIKQDARLEPALTPADDAATPDEEGAQDADDAQDLDDASPPSEGI